MAPETDCDGEDIRTGARELPEFLGEDSVPASPCTTVISYHSNMGFESKWSMVIGKIVFNLTTGNTRSLAVYLQTNISCATYHNRC